MQYNCIVVLVFLPCGMQNQVQVNLVEMATETCVGCGWFFFEKAILIKRIPALMVGASVDQHVPVEVFRCGKCGRPHNPPFPIPGKKAISSSSEELASSSGEHAEPSSSEADLLPPEVRNGQPKRPSFY